MMPNHHVCLWRLVLTWAASWLAIVSLPCSSFGQDFFGPGAVWKLKVGYPQPEKNLQFMISVKQMQVSPGQLSTNVDGGQAQFTFTAPPETLVVGNTYTVSLQGVSYSGPEHKIPSASISLSQDCISKYAGAKDGERTHQRNLANRSVNVMPPPYKTELSYPNNDPKQLLTVSHSDELTFQFQPKTSGFDSDRSFGFYVSPNVGQTGVCVYEYVYEPFTPAPAAPTATATTFAIGPSPSGTTPGQEQPPQDESDYQTLLLQILAVLLGTGLAWLFPSLIHTISNALQGAGNRQNNSSSSLALTANPYWDEDLPSPPKPIGLGRSNRLSYNPNGTLNLADPATANWAIRIAHHHIYITGKPAGMYPPELQFLADGLFAMFGEPSALTPWPNWLFVPDPPTVTTSGVFASRYLERVAGLQTVDVVITDSSGATRVEQRLAAPDGIPPHVTSLGFDRRVVTDTLGRAVHVIDPPDSVVVSFPDRANLPVVQTRVSNDVGLRA
ncbi:MAG: hypothetical protein J0M17_22165, partial [Planctomycetes bacterium]|nr:hypothetical protein [Planctomycetota bacterium]